MQVFDAVQVDAISEALMPAGVRGLRSMFHATAVEVLLYLTPVHCQDMLDSLTTSLNATFTSFMKRNPAFKVCTSTCRYCWHAMCIYMLQQDQFWKQVVIHSDGHACVCACPLVC